MPSLNEIALCNNLYSRRQCIFYIHLKYIKLSLVEHGLVLFENYFQYFIIISHWKETLLFNWIRNDSFAPMISWQNEKIFQDQQFFLTTSILFSLRKGRDPSFEQKVLYPWWLLVVHWFWRWGWHQQQPYSGNNHPSQMSKKTGKLRENNPGFFRIGLTVDWLIDRLYCLTPVRKNCIHMETSSIRTKGCKISMRPMFGPYGLWAGRDL